MSGETANFHARYLYRDYLQVAECDLTGETPVLVRSYLWDPSEPEATRVLAMTRWEANGTQVKEHLYCMHDAMKNVTSLFGEARGRRALYEYRPYGGLVTSEGNMAQENKFRFSCEYMDDELGLIYYNYRHLNPNDGRWISRDPIMEQGGWNLFAFVNNNGIINFDYLGSALTKQMFVDCFFVKAFVITKGFWGYNKEPWNPDVKKKKGKSPIFALSISGYWRIKGETKLPSGEKCPCTQVRKLYEESYPFSVTVSVYDIDFSGKEEMRYSKVSGLPINTLLGKFHEQEITLGTVFATGSSPNSIVASGTVSYPLYPQYNKGIRVIVDVSEQEIYNQVHNFSY